MTNAVSLFVAGLSNNDYDCEVLVEIISDAGYNAFNDGYGENEAPFVDDLLNEVWTFGWFAAFMEEIEEFSE